MECPACHRVLRSRRIGEIVVDVCHDGCGGIWFDQGELSKFDEPSEFQGEALHFRHVGLHLPDLVFAERLLGGRARFHKSDVAHGRQG